MSETVLVALISAGSLIVVALLGSNLFVANRTRKHAKAASDHASDAAYQVKNDHSSNLRENIDLNHRQVLGAIGQIHLVLASLDGRVSEVEETQPGHSRFKPPSTKGRHA